MFYRFKVFILNLIHCYKHLFYIILILIFLSSCSPPTAELTSIINFLSPTRQRATLFYVELASLGYLGFGGYFIINFLSPDCLHDFLFYVDLASPGCAGFWGFLIITVFFPARLRAFLFYVELASRGYLGLGFFSIINMLFLDRPCDSFFYVELASPGYLGLGFYLIINLLSPASRCAVLYCVELASPICVSSFGGDYCPHHPLLDSPLVCMQISLYANQVSPGYFYCPLFFFHIIVLVKYPFICQQRLD